MLQANVFKTSFSEFTNLWVQSSDVAIWAVFTALFFYMALREWKKSKKPMDSLKAAKSLISDSGDSGVKVSIGFAGMDFGTFLREVERSTQESHGIAAISYCLAGVVALASLILSILH
ncbi:MAG: hypothetical protein WC400_02025 [Patescibacteria group bacterium]|jgi:hypothetical protein